MLSEPIARRYTQWLQQNRALATVGMLVAWRAFDFVFQPVFMAAIKLLYPSVVYG